LQGVSGSIGDPGDKGPDVCFLSSTKIFYEFFANIENCYNKSL